MRTALKMVLPLIVSVAVVSVLFAWYQVRTEKRILRSDLSRRAETLGEALQESVEPLLDHAPDKNLQRLVDRFGEREHLKGVAVYDTAGSVLAITPGIAKEFGTWPETVKIHRSSGRCLRQHWPGTARPSTYASSPSPDLFTASLPQRFFRASV